MTEEKFSELVNLYLDKEISTEDLASLKAELSYNAERKVEFQERCRLNQAMRLAMGGASRSSYTRKSSGSSSRRKSAAPTSRRSGTSMRSRAASSTSRRLSQSANSSSKIVDTPPVVHFPRWIQGVGLAACLAIGGMMLYPVFTDTTHVSKQTLEGIDEGELKEAADPLDLVNRSDLKRFATNHQRVPRRRTASLAAELRLLGLHPEVMEQGATLSEISITSIQPRDVSRRRVILLNQMKEYSPIPKARILATAEPMAKRSKTWPAGFQTTLARF